MTQWGCAVMSGESAAFMSYVRFNDQHDDGQLTQFRERLAAEVRAQTGEEFLIFQDRNDIAWGQNWQARIDETLDSVTLLLAIITPSFFRSPACRAEVERFLARERELGRQDLILPVYYIGAPELDDPKRREADKLARVLASRQFADWRELRFEPFTSPVVRRAVAELAHRMRDTFWRQPSAQPSRPGQSGQAVSQMAGFEATMTPQATTAGPAAKTDPPTHVVDAFPNRGDFTEISAAIAAAQPGDRILVRPGLYREGLVVDKPLEILGDGPVAKIEVQALGASVLSFKAGIGRVANLTLRQAGGDGKWFGVDITQGRLELEGCDIASESLACVGIRNGADPRLRRNRIHDGKQPGVLIYDSGLGTLDDNEISANRMSGVEIRAGGNPTLRRNQIHDNKLSGVLVQDNGLETLEDNEITANAFGMMIVTGGNPTLRRNQIHDNKHGGIGVQDNGLGTLEDNDITANGPAGVTIISASNPTLRGNRINRNERGVWIFKDGRGVIEDNDLTGNEKGALDISEDSKPNVKRSGNRV